MAIILWNKKYTETLAETLKRFRLEKTEHNDKKVTYAGRLDPMAEGLVILLTANDVYKKDQFLSFDKTYEIDFILGVETDTYDILGLISRDVSSVSKIRETDVKTVLNKFLGKHNQKYPVYSSKPVDGKPLFMWARENKLDEIIIPTKNIEIYSIEYHGKKQISTQSFQKDTITNIQKVSGDFRQGEIVDTWQHYFNMQKNDKVIYTIRVKSSSGAYMRSLVHNIGKSLGTSACSVKIKRLSVGNYSL